MDIGKVLKELRKKRGITQKGLSNLTGISQTYISQLEGGDKAGTMGTLEEICNKLDMPFALALCLALGEEDFKSHDEKQRWETLQPVFESVLKQLII